MHAWLAVSLLSWLEGPALGAPASVTADFDADGKPETVRSDGEMLKLGALEVYCGDGPCELEVLDIAPDKPGKELAVCTFGPRGERSCQLYRKAKAWSELPLGQLPPPTSVVAKGNGILLAYYANRFASRVEKLAWSPSGLTLVPQPFWSTVTEKDPDGFSFTPDRSFPIVLAPGRSEVVANVATGNVVQVLLEQVNTAESHHYDQRWFLVRLSSGLCGWATLQSLIDASDQLQATAGAG